MNEPTKYEALRYVNDRGQVRWQPQTARGLRLWRHSSNAVEWSTHPIGSEASLFRFKWAATRRAQIKQKQHGGIYYRQPPPEKDQPA